MTLGVPFGDAFHDIQRGIASRRLRPENGIVQRVAVWEEHRASVLDAPVQMDGHGSPLPVDAVQDRVTLGLRSWVHAPVTAQVWHQIGEHSWVHAASDYQGLDIGTGGELQWFGLSLGGLPRFIGQVYDASLLSSHVVHGTRYTVQVQA